MDAKERRNRMSKTAIQMAIEKIQKVEVSSYEQIMMKSSILAFLTEPIFENKMTLLEIEKQQIKQAFEEGIMSDVPLRAFDTPEDYYKETYGNNR